MIHSFSCNIGINGLAVLSLYALFLGNYGFAVIFIQSSILGRFFSYICLYHCLIAL